MSEKNNRPARGDFLAARWLQEVPDPVLDQLRNISEVATFADKEIVYELGAEQVWIWGVRSGKVRVHVTLNEMDPTLGHIHQPGAWFGESEPIQSVPAFVEMQAAGETVLVRTRYNRFRRLAYEHPVLFEGLAKLTSFNQTLSMCAANDLALRSSKKRLAATLLRLAGRRADIQLSTPADSIPTNQQEVANLANVSLATASKILSEFTKLNLIRPEYAHIVVLNPEQLQSILLD